MVFPEFTYYAPKSLEEASELAIKLGSGARLMSGGTDTMPPMQDHAISPEYIIDLKTIPGNEQIEYIEGEGFHIGSQAKLYDIQRNPSILVHNPAVADAAHYVASKHVRTKGTMTGNICNASPSADTAPILLAMDASVKTYTAAPEGGRTIKISDFWTGFKKTALQQGEIITEIDIPDLKEDEYAAYLKHSVRRAMDLAIIGVAAWIKMDGNVVSDCRIALGGVDITTVRAPEAENILIGNELTEDLLEAAGVAASENCHPISDVRASKEYRIDMVRVFTKRAIRKAFENKNCTANAAQ